jgi:hypothetical protein
VSAHTFGANGALSQRVWGNAPGFGKTKKPTSGDSACSLAEARFQRRVLV